MTSKFLKLGLKKPIIFIYMTTTTEASAILFNLLKSFPLWTSKTTSPINSMKNKPSPPYIPIPLRSSSPEPVRERRGFWRTKSPIFDEDWKSLFLAYSQWRLRIRRRTRWKRGWYKFRRKYRTIWITPLPLRLRKARLRSPLSRHIG